MTLAAQLTATLVTGPQQVTDNPFPSGVATIAFGLNPPQKQYNVTTGDQVINVNSPNSYQTVDCIGTGGAVTQATTLFIRVMQGSGMMVQKTYNNLSGTGTTTITEPLGGTMLVEYPTNGALIGLGIQGAGQVELWAAGNQ
jgi:hypothetical protein